MTYLGVTLARPEKKSQIGQPPMKVQIKKAARDLFIRRGIGDVSYGDIAAMVNTTAANLHYHFGNKQALVAAVFQETFDFVEAHLKETWLTPDLTLDQRIALTAEDCRERFYEFNDDDRGRCPWSLSTRARYENHLLSPEIQRGISNMSRDFEEYVTHAVKLAIGNGELRPDTPVSNVVMLLTPLWYFGSLLTQHGSFSKLMRHYAAVRETIQSAYGAEGREVNPEPGLRG